MKGSLTTVIKERNIHKSYCFDALVTNVAWNISTTGKPYLRMILKNRDSSINATKWNAHKEELAAFQTNHYFQIKGKFNIFNQENQFVIEDWKVLSKEEINKEELLPTPPQDLAKMQAELVTFIKSITDPDYKLILEKVFNDEILQLFSQVRGGLKIHHSVYGGLLWHTLTMLKTAQQILPIYRFLPINRDLLYAGIIFHDLGKIKEVGDFFNVNYSIGGNLLGHISLGSLWLEKVTANLPINPTKKQLLQHLILASHGKLEHGSPVKPSTIEAVLLHHLDQLDAEMGKIFTLYHSHNHDQIDQSLVKGFWFHHKQKNDH